MSVFSIPPNLLGIKIQKYKLTHNIDSFDALKSLFCSKTGVRVFFPPPPPHLIWIRFQKIIFSLLRKIFGVHFLLSSSNLLGIKIQKYKSPHNFDSFEALKSLFCSKIGVHFFSSSSTYLRFDSQRFFFSLLRKIFGVHFFSTPLTYLGLKFKNRNHLTALTVLKY